MENKIIGAVILTFGLIGVAVAQTIDMTPEREQGLLYRIGIDVDSINRDEAAIEQQNSWMQRTQDAVTKDIQNLQNDVSMLNQEVQISNQALIDAGYYNQTATSTNTSTEAGI